MGKQVTRRTPEERKAQAEALHASIADQVQQLTDSDQWRKFLDFTRSFHTYSLNNLLLILSQRPDASAVAGFRQWQAKGRQVRRGEKAIKIFGYSTKKITEEDPETGDEVEKRLTRFPVLSVFDIDQTDPIDGAEILNPVAQLTGTDDHGVLVPLTAHLEAIGWTVTTEHLNGPNGYADPERNTVVLHDELAPEQAAKTLIHEAAHITLGHVDDADEYRAHRGRMETEAESVAYVVAGMLGFDTSAYSIGYIAGWADGNADVVRATAARVLAAAHTIADVFTPDEIQEAA
ncbi:ArdC-like ssDNA-binding domain-containing protein [uncultured Leifsonia sp.]|uniref:ArdC-like ssDNA-binding domain-containing protein n=1 Tax=uncultured Leifsonia sp. TaxID=340359 RepID=UPI0025CFF39C|nr:ArdC-like ssDNA-binding domain-containing protein [uncultured Leifsonia sp.]